MPTTPLLHVTKLEAARRQLHTAIDLWASDSDPISIHSLAFAAHQIVHDLNRKNKGPHLLLDSPLVRPEKRDEFIYIVKRDANFFKHADGRQKRKTPVLTEIDFNPDINELFMALTVVGLEYMGQKLTELEVAFYTWYRVNHPDVLTDAGRELFEKSVPAQGAASLRAMKKREFLDRFVQLLVINQRGVGA